MYDFLEQGGGTMDFDNAVEQIVSRVKELGIGIQFNYEEVNQWLRISFGNDLMRPILMMWFVYLKKLYASTKDWTSSDLSIHPEIGFRSSPETV